MTPVCVVIALTLVAGSDPKETEIGRFHTYRGCNEMVVDNIDKYDSILSFNIDSNGNRVRFVPEKPVNYLDGYGGSNLADSPAFTYWPMSYRRFRR